MRNERDSVDYCCRLTASSSVDPFFAFVRRMDFEALTCELNETIAEDRLSDDEINFFCSPKSRLHDDVQTF